MRFSFKKRIKYKGQSIINAFIFLLIFGIGFILGSIFVYNRTKNIIDNGNITEAIIISIKTDRFDDDHLIVIVSYNVNGIQYTNYLGTYVMGMKVGQKVPIHYLIEDPGVIKYAKYEYVLFRAFLGFGIAATIGSLFTFRYYLKTKKNQNMSSSFLDEENFRVQD